MLLKDFIKLNEKEREESLVEDSISKIERAIERKRMDMEDRIAEAKDELRKVSTITSLENFDPKKWVDLRNHALDQLKLAEAHLKNFNENFKK